jgi:hypothetical protein
VNPLDLTTEGTTDWVMLGRSGSTANRDEKAGADYIGAVTVVGTHDTYAANAYLSRWTDGSPTATASDIQGCWEVKPPAIDDIQALQFSVAGLTPGAYTMKLYCSRYKATGRLTASNDTESYSADFDEGGAGVDSVYGVFTVNFPITFTGESLDVSLDVTALGHSVYGNVAISAITLVQTSIDDWIVDDISIELGTGGTEISFSFGTSVGATYGVQATDDLTDPTSWTNLITGISGDGDIVSVTSPVSAGPEFYRIYIEN